MTTGFNNYRAHDDFDKALRRAAWRDWFSLLTGKKNNLLSFDEIRRGLPLRGQHYLGFQMVSLDKIVGSEGRFHEFDRAFYPREKHSKDRWLRIDEAHYDEIVLPPVELIKVGESYFVRDGNHRVSVARVWGHQVIDAYVTEMEVATGEDSTGSDLAQAASGVAMPA